jgi:hypothetical protein
MTMTQKDLGKALLKLGVTELSGLPDAREQTWRILERDRRRVRLLTGMTIGAWLLSTLLIFTVLVAFGFLFPRVAKLRMDVEQGKVTQDQGEQLRNSHDLGLMKGTLVIALSVAALTFAAICTVMLNLTTRRATLRQINASLLEISAQLKELRSPPSRSPG